MINNELSQRYHHHRSYHEQSRTPSQAPLACSCRTTTNGSDRAMAYPMNPTYWRFIMLGIGELCGPCAWVLLYRWAGMGIIKHNSISVHESSKMVITCSRCRRREWTLTRFNYIPEKVA